MFDGQSKQRIKQLCDLIAKEQDHQQFSLLIAELNQLLEDVQPVSGRSGGVAPIPPSSGSPDPSREPEC